MNKNQKLEKWMKSRCEYSDCIFTDPGYDNEYKSFFIKSTHSDQNKYYANKLQNNELERDIDIKVSSGYIMADETDETKYIDLIGTNKKEKIYLPPGSNQSNCNYLYKKIANILEENESPVLDKKKFYMFLMKYSK
jgi:hypothetical protein